jgi:hypothetical protein
MLVTCGMFVVFPVSSINKPDCYDITETESSMEHTNGIKEPFLLEGVVSPTFSLYCHIFKLSVTRFFIIFFFNRYQGKTCIFCIFKTTYNSKRN